MKKYILLPLLLCLLASSAMAQTKRKQYLPAYETNKETTLRLAKELQLNRKSPEIIAYLKNFPVLEDLKEYSSRKKYSLILSSVIRDKREDEDKDLIVFILKNGKEYKIKKSKRSNTTLSSQEAKSQ